MSILNLREKNALNTKGKEHGWVLVSKNLTPFNRFNLKPEKTLMFPEYADMIADNN